MAFRVLIVDDSPVMRAFVRRVLAISGLEADPIFEASDGQEALDLLEDQWVDVVLTDINMPNMDGEEFVTKLSERGLLSLVTVVVISTDATSSRMEHLHALGAHGYLSKPFLPEALRAEVERAMGVRDVA
jgi:two-component system, chemotaxis family, chemotaxis protein CheY